MPNSAGVKQVIVVRSDLKMNKGKIAAQAAHASLGAVFKGSFIKEDEDGSLCKSVPLDPSLTHWFEREFTKVCLKVTSEEELDALEKECIALDLRHCLITDSGHTVFNGVPTKTVLAIGPALSKDIDVLTSNLKLL